MPDQSAPPAAPQAADPSQNPAADAAAASILLVDDDDGIRTLVAGFLRRHGYRVAGAANAAAMDRALAADPPFDLIVLDLMLPGEHGLSIAKRLSGPHAPAIIILSAAGDASDRILGLEVGADDYLAKPCNPRELLARIRAVLRRKAAAPVARVAAFAGWTFDLIRRQLKSPAGVLISLSDSEFLLLKALVDAPTVVLTREQLLQRTHSDAGAGGLLPERAIDVQVSRLRHKLETGGGEQLVRTIRNGGYLFAAEVTWS